MRSSTLSDCIGNWNSIDNKYNLNINEDDFHIELIYDNIAYETFIDFTTDLSNINVTNDGRSKKLKLMLSLYNDKDILLFIESDEYVGAITEFKRI